MANEMKEELGSPLCCSCPDRFAGAHFCHRSAGNSHEEERVNKFSAGIDIVSMYISNCDKCTLTVDGAQTWMT